MSKLKLVVSTIVFALFAAEMMYAGINKKSDSSVLAMPPIYDQTGVIGSDVYGNTASFTDARGDTSTITCVGSNCSESTGVSHFITLPNKHRLYINTHTAIDLDHWEGRSESIVYATFDDHMDQIEGQAVHFRIRDAAILINTPDTHIAHFLCTPIKVDLNGKSREEYAKHHSVEACHKILG